MRNDWQMDNYHLNKWALELPAKEVATQGFQTRLKFRAELKNKNLEGAMLSHCKHN